RDGGWDGVGTGAGDAEQPVMYRGTMPLPVASAGPHGAARPKKSWSMLIVTAPYVAFAPPWNWCTRCPPQWSAGSAPGSSSAVLFQLATSITSGSVTVPQPAFSAPTAPLSFP